MCHVDEYGAANAGNEKNKSISSFSLEQTILLEIINYFQKSYWWIFYFNNIFSPCFAAGSDTMFRLPFLIYIRRAFMSFSAENPRY